MNDFEAVMALITLLADPAAAEGRLTELRSTIDAAADRQAEADAAHAKLGNECERLTKLEASLREREVAVFASERRHERDLDEMRKWQREHAPNRLITVGPGGLTKELDLTENAPDPISDPMAEEMDLDPIGHSAVQTGQARKSLRRIRV